MLKEFAEIWRDGGLMKDVTKELAQMLSDAEYVYDHAWEVCCGQAVIATTEEPLRSHDRAVNQGEREIRRMLVEHLTIHPGRDVSGCLALMIMAKDVERIGDHAKNIFKMGVELQGKAHDLKAFDQLNRLQVQIGESLPKLERAVLDSDEALAHEILVPNKQIKATCAELTQLSLRDTQAAREAVITALLTRFLKRINAHVCNVATGIIFPLENIDFVNRGLRQESEQ